MKGYRLTNKQSMNIILNEIDKALTLPKDFEKIISPFINKNVDIQDNKYSKQ